METTHKIVQQQRFTDCLSKLQYIVKFKSIEKVFKSIKYGVLDENPVMHAMLYTCLMFYFSRLHIKLCSYTTIQYLKLMPIEFFQYSTRCYEQTSFIQIYLLCMSNNAISSS